MRRLLPLVLLACEQVDQETPTPPNQAALVQAYANPTGTLDEASLPRLVEGLAERGEELARLAGLAGALDGLEDVRGPQESSSGLGVRRDALSTDGAAWARITRRCQLGGEIVALAVFEGEVPDVLWGTVSACAEPGEDGAQTYTGEVWLGLNDDLSEFLLLFDGSVEEGGVESPLRVDLLLQTSTEGDAPVRAATLQEVDGETFIVGVESAFDEGRALVTVRDGEGRWTCDLEACAGPDGRTVRR